MSTCDPHACGRPGGRPLEIVSLLMAVFGLDTIVEGQAAQRTTRPPQRAEMAHI